MALRWVLHSACHVLGYPKESNNNEQQQPREYCDMGRYEKEGYGGGGVMIQSSENKTVVLSGFQMPLHYPRYTKADYEKMEEWKVDMLLREYGLSFGGTIDEKREYAMGTFLWPDQY